MTGLLLLVVAALVGILFLPAAVARPARTILPLYAATLPIASVIKLGVPLPAPFNTLSSLLGAMVVLLSLAHVARTRRARVPTLPDAMWMLLLGWSGLTAAWAIKSTDALQMLTVAAPLILLVVVTATLEIEEVDLEVLRLALIASGIVIGLYALGLLVFGKPLPTHGVSQRFSIQTNAQDTNPNILAASLLLPLVLSVERILLGGRRWLTFRGWQLLGVVGAFFSSLAIVFTGSRGGVLSAIIAFTVCLKASRRIPAARPMIHRIVAAIVAAILAGVVGFLFALTISPEGTARQILSTSAINRLTNTSSDGSGRLDIWTAGYRACVLHCGWGAGLGNFPNAFDETFAFSGASKNVGQNRPAHDIYLQIVVETGIIGLTLFVLALMAELWEINRRPALVLQPSLKAGLTGILVANVFLSAIWFKYFWLVLVFIRVSESAAPPRSAIPADEPEALAPSRELASSLN